MIDIKGTGVALVTPFNEDNTVDTAALEQLVDYQIKNGADYLVVMGTTGEAATLTRAERRLVADVVHNANYGAVPLVLGVSSNSTAALVEELREFEFRGFDAILSVVPFYNRPSQQGILAHFSAVAQASPLPVILYNVPSRTGTNMDAATTLQLAHDFPGKIIGIKEASGRIGQIREIIERRPKGFRVLSGDDALTLPLIAMGAEGVISVIANALPERFCRLTHLALEGRFTEAAVIDRPLQPLYRALFADGNPAGIKALLSIMNMCRNTLRLPLTPVTSPTLQTLTAALANLPVI